MLSVNDINVYTAQSAQGVSFPCVEEGEIVSLIGAEKPPRCIPSQAFALKNGDITFMGSSIKDRAA